MTTSEIYNRVLNSDFLIMNESDLNQLLKESEILKEFDTHLSDFIRLLKFEDKLFLQETSLDKVIIIREIESLEKADKFIQDRLDFYERKWDGCGCKIDYFE